MRALLLVVIVTGCGSSSSGPAEPAEPPPPTCEALLARFEEVQIGIALEGSTDPEERALLEARSDDWMPSRAECDAWSAAFKRCLYAVKTEADNFRCSRESLLAQGVDMGGPDCATVVEHMSSFLFAESLRSDVELMTRAKQRLGDGCVAMPRKMKECTLEATSVEAYVGCADPRDRALVGRALTGIP